MLTSFEILPRSRRKIARSRLVFPIFLLVSVVAMSGFFFLRESVQELQAKYAKEAEAIDQRKEALLDQAWKSMPDPKVISDLESQISAHNYMLIGSRTPWSEFFQALEEELPEGAVIAKIEDPRSGKPLFQAGESDFKITVVVADGEVANTFYKRISAKKSFQSLSFTPKGEITYQGRKGISIEIVFHFEAAS